MNETKRAIGDNVNSELIRIIDDTATFYDLIKQNETAPFKLPLVKDTPLPAEQSKQEEYQSVLTLYDRPPMYNKGDN